MGINFCLVAKTSGGFIGGGGGGVHTLVGFGEQGGTNVNSSFNTLMLRNSVLVNTNVQKFAVTKTVVDMLS